VNETWRQPKLFGEINRKTSEYWNELVTPNPCLEEEGKYKLRSYVLSLCAVSITVSQFRVTIDGVWIGEFIY
jgi:hypothetical protein